MLSRWRTSKRPEFSMANLYRAFCTRLSTPSGKSRRKSAFDSTGAEMSVPRHGIGTARRATNA